MFGSEFQEPTCFLIRAAKLLVAMAQAIRQLFPALPCKAVVLQPRYNRGFHAWYFSSQPMLLISGLPLHSRISASRLEIDWGRFGCGCHTRHTHCTNGFNSQQAKTSSLVRFVAWQGCSEKTTPSSLS
jgi:hypothetical protein